MDRERVRREYHELSLAAQRLRAARDSELHPSAVHPLNKNKNRYPDVLPVEETRVRLSPVGEIPASDYINANLVRSDEKFSAICSQAPLPHTFDDFWRMVWEQVRFWLGSWLFSPLQAPSLQASRLLRLPLSSFCYLVGCSYHCDPNALAGARKSERAPLLAHQQI